MELEKLFLTKEELPIIHQTGFQIPVHPKLLDENIKIRKNIAHEVFPKAVEEWYKDLIEYSKHNKNQEEKEWIKRVFLKEKPKIKKHFGSQRIMDLWEDETDNTNNGFVRCFSISRDAGGTIYFNKGDLNCKAFIPSLYIKFAEEKSKEFSAKESEKYDSSFVYSQHNVDYYPGALFLRNWAILYMNEVFKEIF